MASFDLTPETSALVKEYAKQRGCTADEAADHLVGVAIGRISALRKYAKKVAKAPAPKKAAKAKAPKAAKAKKAKAPKAKPAAAAATA